MKLLGNHVLVEPIKPATVSAGGILMPQQYQDDQTQWRVLGVGPGKLVKGILRPIEVSAGDRVLAPLYNSHTILGDGRRLIDADSIIAVIGHDSQTPQPQSVS